MSSLVELTIDLKQESWTAFCTGVYPNLKTLELRIGLQVWLSEDSHWHESALLHPFPQLERLKLLPSAARKCIPILQLTFPSLHILEFGTTSQWLIESIDEEMVVQYAQFVERHPTIQVISLGRNYVRSMGRIMQSTKNLRALHASLPFSDGSLRSVPESLDAAPHITHLRLSGLLTSVLTFLKCAHTFPHFRCLELDCENAKDFDFILQLPTSRHDTLFHFSQLRELAPSLVEVAFDISFRSQMPVQETLLTLLERLQGCGELRALRLRNLDLEPSAAEFPIELVEHAEAIPPKLQFIVWGDGRSVRAYQLNSDHDSSGCKKVTRISLPHSTPSNGRWSLDWHEESVFDHINQIFDVY
ncbi:hypothetical protein SCHPADRAFT_161541 [Schizopora paradoxa]|uniref:F-box domain-containing protein n=1 Tax=Schizopora paradoxa TaxID=27342 RepID=A0A0H2S159_9AGAM|nr:hypothetical protein SCHPADRAFT_161541 [Schizopora paradoxa]